MEFPKLFQFGRQWMNHVFARCKGKPQANQNRDKRSSISENTMFKGKVVRPARVELATFWFVDGVQNPLPIELASLTDQKPFPLFLNGPLVGQP
jgi:hypothetical protein